MHPPLHQAIIEPCKKMPRLQVTVLPRYQSDTDSEFDSNDDYCSYYPRLDLLSENYRLYNNPAGSHHDSALIYPNQTNPYRYHRHYSDGRHENYEGGSNHENDLYNNSVYSPYQRPVDELPNWCTISALLQYLASVSVSFTVG